MIRSTASHAGQDYVVRVIAPAPGLQSAAFSRLTRMVIGHALTADLVVRHPAMKGRLLAIIPDEDGASIEVLGGEVTLLGRVLEAGAQAFLPPYVPMLAGDVAIAYGRPDDPAWARAVRLAERLGAPNEPSALRVDSPKRPLARPAWVALARPFLMACGGGLLVAASVASCATGKQEITQATQIADLLRRSGYGELVVRERSGRPPVVAGVLADDARVARLMALLEARHVRADMAVSSGSALARRVEDLFRSRGLAASATAGRRGEVAVALFEDADPLQAANARQDALRTMPSLRTLRLVAAETPASRPPSAADRVVAIQPGADGYVTTADGSKYFAGGQLPTGQTIRAIEAHRLVVDGPGGVNTLDLKGPNS